MNGFLLDTNVISEVVRVKPDANVTTWISSTDENLLHISVLTLGEIRKGIVTLPQSRRRAQLEAWMEAGLKQRFGDRVLSIDADIADRWVALSVTTRARGKPASVIDGLLAATAQHFNLTIVTQNVGDFADSNVPVLNPWK